VKSKWITISRRKTYPTLHRKNVSPKEEEAIYKGGNTRKMSADVQKPNFQSGSSGIVKEGTLDRQ